MSKFIFITGGVCSSLGKGVAAASIASLLECRGFTVNMVKCDPYINVDAGTISPRQHGEVYVTDDGAETDLDLGTYARFSAVRLSRANSITTGKVYQEVIAREREGRYNGKTVQVIPHITDEIKRCVTACESADIDAVIVEIGGVVGDIESIPFLEAVRQIIRERGKQNALSIHMTLVPAVSGGELKTKPTQHSVKTMHQTGIQPDVLICRVPSLLDETLRKKIALFCNVNQSAVFSSIDVERTVYELPICFNEQGLDSVIVKMLNLPDRAADLRSWESFLKKLQNASDSLRIAIVGGYGNFDNCYKSVREAVFHAATDADISVDFIKVDAVKLERSPEYALNALSEADGIIIPSNGGPRGVLGMIDAATYARERKIPFLGIDTGMHVMLIETARRKLGWDDADSTEFTSDTAHPIVCLPEERKTALRFAPSSSVGNYSLQLEEGGALAKAYGVLNVSERRRRKYEFDQFYRADIESAGLLVCALSDGVSRESDAQNVAAVEWADHPWGVGVQFHPEFKSKPTAPHPLFKAYIQACMRK